MCLASAVVLCPVLLRGHPSLIPLTRCLSVPLPLFFSQWLFLLSSQLPAAFSWARSVCTKSQPGHRVPLSSKPSFWYWCLLPAVLGCDRHSPALDPWCIPQTPTHVSPLSLTPGGSYFSGRSTAPLALQLCPLQLKGNRSCALLWRTMGCALPIGGSGCNACFNKCLSYKCAALLKWFHL